MTGQTTSKRVEKTSEIAQARVTSTSTNEETLALVGVLVETDCRITISMSANEIAVLNRSTLSVVTLNVGVNKF